MLECILNWLQPNRRKFIVHLDERNLPTHAEPLTRRTAVPPGAFRVLKAMDAEDAMERARYVQYGC